MVTGELEWDDYRIAARMRSTTAGAIGLVFRYREALEHYRFVNDAAGSERRLVRVSGGVPSVVWSDASPFPAGTTAIVSVECVGDVITGYVNGVEVFRVADPAGPPAGRVGLLCAGDPEARFADVRVGRAGWSTWHRFGEELPLGAGRELVVQAGSAADDGADPPLVERRFKAAVWERGAPTLHADGADLRVVGRDGTAEHTRPVLPDRMFSATALRVLRKEDGTGMFIAPATGDLSPGLYRLRLTYRRDNRAADPQSRVLRQAGQTTPEQVVIEVPWRSRS